MNSIKKIQLGAKTEKLLAAGYFVTCCYIFGVRVLIWLLCVHDSCTCNKTNAHRLLLSEFALYWDMLSSIDLRTNRKKTQKLHASYPFN